MKNSPAEISVDRFDDVSPEKADLPPIMHVLTRVLVHSLCPLFKSEIIFGEIEDLTGPKKFDHWATIRVDGDFRGQIGVAADRHTFESIGTHVLAAQGGAPAVGRFLINLLGQQLEEKFKDENFQCRVVDHAVEANNYVLERPDTAFFLCPVESRFGTLRFYFSLTPSAAEISTELENLRTQSSTRKIRVYAFHLDMLYAQVKNLEKLEEQLLSGAHVRAEMRAELKKLKRVVHHLKTDSLEMLFLPARALVTDIAKHEGKQVTLVTRGTWLHLDKTLLNHLYEPILHLIRNAVDHGIEDPTDRERQGKSAAGVIRCLASFSEKGLRFVISDDGRGLDFPQIRLRAVARGMVSEFEAQQKLPDDLCELIFEPGVSTREKADAISGRGLGLDIVRKRIESLGGKIKVLSTSHHGTSFEISIPLQEDFGSKNLSPLPAVANSREEEEVQILLDELSRYLERLPRALAQLKKNRNPESAYEAFRLVHSVKGVAGFLGWNRVTNFCHYLEDLLKLVAEQRLVADEAITRTVLQAGDALKVALESSRTKQPFSLYEIRRIEGLILQTLWSANHHEDKTQFFFGKYHLGAVQKLLDPFFPSVKVKALPESDFRKALELPYGALVQFNGDRRGYAGILLPETTFQNVIYPFVTGASTRASIKEHLWTLNEFANLMGAELTEMTRRSNVNLLTSAPLTYFGWGQPLKHLGNPTYCYACELNGHTFYLVGDFRTPYDSSDRFLRGELPNFDPDVVCKEAVARCQEHFSSQWSLPVEFREMSSQSELVGFDGGTTAIISCLGQPSSVLFLSYENGLAQHLHGLFSEVDSPRPIKGLDVFDCMGELSNFIGGLLVGEMEKRGMRMRLSLPSVFIGKAYVANFNRLYVTNKFVGLTPKGKLELQVLVTKHPE